MVHKLCEVWFPDSAFKTAQALKDTPGPGVVAVLKKQE